MMTRTPRVLVIGRIPDVNQRVVALLVERGLAAVGAAGEGDFPDLDASGFELVAIGSGVDPETRAILKQRFAAQNPAAIVLDVYGPLAARQIDVALRQASGAAMALGGLALDDAGDAWHALVTVTRECPLQLDVHRFRGPAAPDVTPLAAVRVTAGTHTFAVAKSFAGAMLVVQADEEPAVRRLPD